MTAIKTARLTWDDPNVGANQETEIRIYRSASAIDPMALPAPHVVLPADTVQWDDETAGFGTYFYAVGAVGATEEVSLLTVDVGIDPTTYDPTAITGTGAGLQRFPATDPAHVWSDAASTVPAVDGGPVLSITDAMGGSTKLIVADCTYQQFRGVWRLVLGSSAKMHVASSTGLYNYLHDETGGEILVSLQCTNAEGEAAVIVDNCNLQTAQIGFALFADRRVSLPRTNVLYHMVTKGTNAAGSPIASSMNNFLKPNRDQVVGCMFQSEVGNDGCISADGSRVYAGKKAASVLSNADENLTFFQRGGSGDFQFQGYYYDSFICDRPFTEDEFFALDKLMKSGHPDVVDEASLFSFATSARTEWFVDLSNVETSTGVAFTVNRPQPYVDGPVSSVAGVSTATWDFDGYYASVRYEGAAGYKCWMGCFDDVGAHAGISYMTSETGRAWTKPDLGIITYDGSTTNNLINTGYDPTVDHDGTEYVMLQGVPDGVAGVEQQNCQIKTSADGITGWTIEQTIAPASYAEFHGMTIRDDGRMLLYYTEGHGTDSRKIGAYLSNTTDFSQPFVDQGVVIDTYDPLDNEQIYNFCGTIFHGVMYGLACRFDDFSERIHSLELHTSLSSDGLTWTPRDGGFVTIGKYGDYDGGMVIGKQITDDGNELRFWYTASNGTHIDSLPRDSRLAYASLPSGRLGRVTGAGGTLTTTALTLTDELYINAISDSGNLSVEVLDASDDSVLTGFAKADCDNLDGDHKALEVTWGGVSAPTGQSVKLKFYLDA